MTKELQSYYADLHIHIGRTEKGVPVKISAARNLTFMNIAREASERKGIGIIGIIDCHSPAVQEDIMRYLDQGEMTELAGGGLQFRKTAILLGCEVEVRDQGMGPAHLLLFMPDLPTMQQFTRWMSGYVKNVNLSSQRIYVPARILQEEVAARGGFLIPAHVFTPHKSVYGSCSTRMSHLLDPDGIAAVELGLSADSEMAAYISETDRFTFVTDSDAHSLSKIGREYNRLALAEPTFNEVRQALSSSNGRRVEANYGLHPLLGKYHRSYCKICGKIIGTEEKAAEYCPYCGKRDIVRGVMDRILEIADRKQPQVPAHRPPYYYQVPLEWIPGLGPRKMKELLERFGTEMNILHGVPREQLVEAAGERVAEYIMRAREGTLAIESGGGGHYGKICK